MEAIIKNMFIKRERREREGEKVTYSSTVYKKVRYEVVEEREYRNRELRRRGKKKRRGGEEER